MNNNSEFSIPNLEKKKFRIGIVCARFYEEIASIQLNSCKQKLIELGFNNENVFVKMVPGALELSIVLLCMAKTFEFDSLIAFGSVIKGKTYHFQVVCNEMASSISRVSLDTGIPIANGVLTVENYNQALIRAEKKGSECAKVAVEMASLMASFPKRRL